jgi:hypothetical protein
MAGVASQTQLERNNIRLKAQYKQVEMENVQLREGKLANREDLERARAVLDDVLNLAELPQELFESLSQVSYILLEMKRRLA